MKFYQSKILHHLAKFRTNATYNGLMRDHESMYLLWKTIEYYQPNNILEIGFYKGQSLGLMIEAAPKANVVSVDKKFQNIDTFQMLFPNNGVQFIQIDSKNLSLNQKFDFINIDGDHSYSGVINDLEKCLPLLHENSILSIDDYKFFEGVGQAVSEKLLGQYNFIPFMCSEQQIFFHHDTHVATEFLDEYIMAHAEFIEFNNINFYGYTVLKGQIFNQAIANDAKIFQSILKFYDI
jgi:hypothetical protein